VNAQRSEEIETAISGNEQLRKGGYRQFRRLLANPDWGFIQSTSEQLHFHRHTQDPARNGISRPCVASFKSAGSNCGRAMRSRAVIDIK